MRKIGSMVAELTLDAKKYTKGTRDAIKQTKSLNSSLTKTSSVMGKVMKAALAMGVALGTAKLTKSFAGLVKESGLLAARYETLGIVIEQLGKNSQYTNEQVHAAAKGIEKAGIEMNVSRQMTARLIQAQVDLAKAHRLARIAQDAAVIGNINSTEAFERLIHGLVTAQPRVLRMIGLQVDFEKAYKKTAKILNKTVENLTALEKQQARTNHVIEYGVRIQGAYEAAMTTAGKQILSFSRYIVDTKTILGEAFLPVIKHIVSEAKELVFAFREWGIQHKEYIEGRALDAWYTLKDAIKAVWDEMERGLGILNSFKRRLGAIQDFIWERNISALWLDTLIRTGSKEEADAAVLKARKDHYAGETVKRNIPRTKLNVTKYYSKATSMDKWWRAEHGYNQRPDMWQGWGTGYTGGYETEEQRRARSVEESNILPPWKADMEKLSDINKEQLDNIVSTWDRFFQDLISGNIKGLGGLGKGLLGALAGPVVSTGGALAGKKAMDWIGKGIGSALGVTAGTGAMIAGGIGIGVMGISSMISQAKEDKHRRHVEQRTRKTEKKISAYESEVGPVKSFISEVVAGSFTKAIETGDFSSFARGLKESVYEAVKGGMIEAMLSSSVIQGIIKPFQEGFSKAFEMSTTMGKVSLPYGGKYSSGAKQIDYIKSFNIQQFMAYMQPWMSSIGSMTNALQPAFSGMSGALNMVGGSLGLGSGSSGIQLGPTNSGMNFSMYANVATTEDASDWIAQVMEEYERKKAAKKAVNKYKDYYSAGTDTGLGP